MEFIAEVGSNWKLKDYGLKASKGEALRLCEYAVLAGATIIKFQIFEANSLYSKERAPELWKRAKQYEFPIDWLSAIWGKANRCNLKVWASVFAPDLVRLTSMYVHGLKIASGDVTYHKLIHEVAKICAKHDLTMALSTGAATSEEINQAIDIVDQYEVKDFVLFNCVSAYPAPLDAMNLRWLTAYKEFADHIGLSDHALTSEAAELSVGLGYTYFEKHFWSGYEYVESPDLCVSLDPDQMKEYINNIKRAEEILGSFDKKISRFEIGERKMARRGSDGLRPRDG